MVTVHYGHNSATIADKSLGYPSGIDRVTSVSRNHPPTGGPPSGDTLSYVPPPRLFAKKHLVSNLDATRTYVDGVVTIGRRAWDSGDMTLTEGT